jgi:hypothetical protein
MNEWGESVAMQKLVLKVAIRIKAHIAYAQMKWEWQIRYSIKRKRDETQND